MIHLTEEEILLFVDGDMKPQDVAKCSNHLDKCLECVHKLQELASISLFLEDIAIQVRIQRQKSLLKDCLDAKTMFDFIEDKVQWKGRREIEQHLAECKYCQEELGVIRSILEKPEIEITEKIEPERYLPKSLHYFELLLIAYEREAVLKKESVKIPFFEKIRSILFPRQPTLVPLGFAEKVERDKEFYKQLRDEELVPLCIEGDTGAWEELIRRFTPYAFGIIKHFGLYEHREDIWEDALQVLLVGGIKDYDAKEGSLKDFIRGTVINLCQVKIREIKKQPLSIEKLTFQEIKNIITLIDPLAQLICEEQAGQVVDVLNSLPKEFSSVAQAMLNGLKDGEMVDSLNIPINTVRSRKRRLRIEIVKIMSKKYPDLLQKIKRYKWGKRNL